MIKKLKIQNFLSVENQLLEFGKINIFVGKTDAGKSIIMRAIDAALNNKYTTAVYAKHGTQAYLISILTNRGLVTLKKANTTQYTVRTQDSTQVFEAVGKKVPEEAQKILNMPVLPLSDSEFLDVLYQSQHKPFFLISENRDVFTKVIALISNADKLRDLEKLVNSDILSIKRKITSLKDVILDYDTQILTQEDKVNTVKKAVTQLEDFEEFEEEFNKIKDKEEKLSRVSKLKLFLLETDKISETINIEGILNLENLSKYIFKFSSLLNTLKISLPDQLPNYTSNLVILGKLSKDLDKLNIPSLDKLEEFSSSLDKVKKLKDLILIRPDEKFIELEECSLKLKSQELISQLSSYYSCLDLVKEQELIYEDIKQQLSSLVGQQCPYCGQTISNVETLCQ